MAQLKDNQTWYNNNTNETYTATKTVHGFIMKTRTGSFFINQDFIDNPANGWVLTGE